MTTNRYSPYAHRLKQRKAAGAETTIDERYLIEFKGTMPSAGFDEFLAYPVVHDGSSTPYASHITLYFEIMIGGAVVAYKSLPHVGILPESAAEVENLWQQIQPALAEELDQLTATLEAQNSPWSLQQVIPLRSATRSPYSTRQGYRFVRAQQGISFSAPIPLTDRIAIKTFYNFLAQWGAELSSKLVADGSLSLVVTQIDITESVVAYRTRTYRRDPVLPFKSD